MIRLNVAQVPSYYSFKVLFGSGTREFNPRYADAEGALLGQLRHIHRYLRKPGLCRTPVQPGIFFDHKKKCEHDQIMMITTIR